MSVYYQDESVTLYHGDCREITAWLEADVLVTDPPYGMGYRSRYSGDEVVGDRDTYVRDEVLGLWGRNRPALVFGSWRNIRPTCDQVLIWDKGEEAALGHPTFFSAFEEIYVIGSGWVGPRRSNVIRVNGMARGGSDRKAFGHPTPKPSGLMEVLIAHCPSGVIADPFAGSGATLVAASLAGRKAIGVEVEERYCEVIAKRLAQGVLDFGDAS